MIKKLWFLVAALGMASPAAAQMSYMDEVKALGAVSGQGLACGASKYDDFELLARAIMLSKAPSEMRLFMPIMKPKPMLIFLNKWTVFMNVRSLTDVLTAKKFLRPCFMKTAPSKCQTAKLLRRASLMMPA